MIIVIAGKQSACPNEKQKDFRRVSNLVLTAHAGTFIRPRNRAGNALRPASGSDRELDHRTITVQRSDQCVQCWKHPNAIRATNLSTSNLSSPQKSGTRSLTNG